MKNLKAAQEFLDGAQRAAQDAERMVRAEAEKLANCGQIFPIKTVENGHQVTRYIGDSAAAFALFMLPGKSFTIDNPKRGGRK